MKGYAEVLVSKFNASPRVTIEHGGRTIVLFTQCRDDGTSLRSITSIKSFGEYVRHRMLQSRVIWCLPASS
jgi:hypothetical protein